MILRNIVDGAENYILLPNPSIETVFAVLPVSKLIIEHSKSGLLQSRYPAAAPGLFELMDSNAQNPMKTG